jgi:putative phosphonate metabolism protein
MRLAVFFTPPPEHPLTRAAAHWLGRDAFSGEEFPPPDCEGLTVDEIATMTAEPRRYGFHATLRPPFSLAEGYSLEDVDTTLETMADVLAPVDLGRLAINEIGAFFALTSGGPSNAIDDLAGAVVRRFDRLRAPPTADEIARRRPERLSARQRDNLRTWGYPYVFSDFRFHMTLTGPVPKERKAAMRNILEERFAPLLELPIVVDGLALFVEPAPSGDFIVRRRIALRRTRSPMAAT